MTVAQVRARWVHAITGHHQRGSLSTQQYEGLMHMIGETFPDDTWDDLAGEATASMMDIVERLLPEVEEHMHRGFRHYGDNHVNLGIKGQFADIWRKIQPLKRALWEDGLLERESPRQICLDLIGHLLLTIRMMDQEAATISSMVDFRDTFGDYGVMEARGHKYEEVPEEQVTPGTEYTTPWYTIKFTTPVGPAFFDKVLRINSQIIEEAGAGAEQRHES